MIEPRTIKVTFESGATEDIKVSPLKVAQFQTAFAAYEQEDELRLVELSTGTPPGWAKTLTLESYSEVVVAMYELNGPGFFAHAGRRSMLRSARNKMPGQMSSESTGANSSPTSARGQG